MGIAKVLLKSGIYYAALVGIFTLLPLPENITFTGYTITPERPLTGPLELNNKLSGITKLFEGKIRGPEGLLNYNNSLYTTLHYGHTVKIVDDQIIPVVKFGKVCDGLHEEHVCGRPLGISKDKNGFLYIADAYYGIFKVNVNSPTEYGVKEQIISMDTVIDGVRPKLPNSVVVASDGTVYWSDSDTNFALYNALYSALADGSGRLLKYDPKTKQNTVLIKNLQFANGIELADDESFILVIESMKYRVLKYYLKGPNAGKTEIFIDGLPGMPDNVKKIGKGSFYFPLIKKRSMLIDNLVQYPTIKMMIAKLFAVIDLTFKTIDSVYPNLYFKKAAHWIGHFESISFLDYFVTPRVSIIEVNEKGIIKSSWYSTDGKISNICDIEVIGDKLYFGSPINNYLGVLKLPHSFV